MPARTVVFDAIRKHDGVRPRDLYPGKKQFTTYIYICKVINRLNDGNTINQTSMPSHYERS